MRGGARYIKENTKKLRKMINNNKNEDEIIDHIKETLRERLQNEYERLKNKKNFKLHDLYAMYELEGDNEINKLSNIFFWDPNNNKLHKAFNNDVVTLPDVYNEEWRFYVSYFNGDHYKHGIVLANPKHNRNFEFKLGRFSNSNFPTLHKSPSPKKKSPTPTKKPQTPTKKPQTPAKKTPTPTKKPKPKKNTNPSRIFLQALKEAGIKKKSLNPKTESLNSKAKPWSPKSQSGGYVNIKGGGTRKVRHYNNGKPYILLNGRKVKI